MRGEARGRQVLDVSHRAENLAQPLLLLRGQFGERHHVVSRLPAAGLRELVAQAQSGEEPVALGQVTGPCAADRTGGGSVVQP